MAQSHSVGDSFRADVSVATGVLAAITFAIPGFQATGSRDSADADRR